MNNILVVCFVLLAYVAGYALGENNANKSYLKIFEKQVMKELEKIKRNI